MSEKKFTGLTWCAVMLFAVAFGAIFTFSKSHKPPPDADFGKAESISEHASFQEVMQKTANVERMFEKLKSLNLK